MAELSKRVLASMIDHTLLKADTTGEQISECCKQAKEYRFASVCVNPCHVALVARELKDSGIKVCTVTGFPLGASMPEVKAFEAEKAVSDGADEVDMVINIGALKERNYQLVEDDITGVVKASKGAIVKVIIETCYLDDSEKEMACKLSKKAGAAFVKTSTSFGPAGATLSDVSLMRRTVGCDMGVKAAGGIRCLKDAVAMIEAGASRIGTSSGKAIIDQMR